MRDTAAAYQERHCTEMAAALSYRVMFSFVPGLALLVAAAGWVLRVPSIEQQLTRWLIARMPLQSDLVNEAVRTLVRSSESLTLLGLLALAWAASAMFATLRTGLNAAWGTRSRRGLVHAKLADFVSIGGLWLVVGFSLLLTMALHAARGAAAQLPGDWSGLHFAGRAAGWLLPSVSSFLAFLIAYRFGPDVAHGWRDVWPGALVATVLFEAGNAGFGLYLAHFSRYQLLYGALGAVLLLMLWIYMSANILFAGATFSAVLEDRARPSRERPSPASPGPPPEESAG